MWDLFKKSIVYILQTVLKIGAATVPEVIMAYNAPLGMLVKSVLTSVVTAEGKLGAGTGPDKRELALMGMQAAMPAIDDVFALSGKPIKNPALFATGLQKIQEGVVDIMNATGEGAKAV